MIYTEQVYNRLIELKNDLCDNLDRNKNEFWDLDIKKLKEMISEIKEEEKKEKFRYRFESILHLTRISYDNEHPLFEPSKKIVNSIIDNILDLIDKERKKNKLNEIIFKNPNDVLEEIEEDEESEINMKNFKKNFEEEKIEMEKINGYVEPIVAKIWIEKLIDNFSNYEINLFKKFNKNIEDCFFSDHIDWISRKKTFFDTTIEGKSVFLNFTLRSDFSKNENCNPFFNKEKINFTNLSKEKSFNLEDFLKTQDTKPKKPKISTKTTEEEFQNKKNSSSKTEIQNKEKENIPKITINNINPKDLQDLIKIVYELDNHSPKYIYLLLKIENKNGELLDCPLNFVIDYLIKEVEFSILKEKGPFIENFEDKLENDVFDDVSLIFTDNLQSFEEFREKRKNEFFLTFNNSFVNLFSVSERFKTYGNILVDCDMNRFFRYSGLISSFYKYPRIFGPNFEKGLNFVRKWYEVYKNQDRKENIQKMIVLGGDFNIDKIKFLLFSREFFEKIYLFGKIGFIFSLFINDIQHDYLDDYTKNILTMFFQYFGPYEEKIIFSNNFLISNEEVKENIEILKEKKDVIFNKEIYLQKQQISENISKIDLTLETSKYLFKSKKAFESQNIIESPKNSKTDIKSEKKLNSLNSVQNIKEKEKTVEEIKEKYEIIDYSFEIIENLIKDIESYDSILIIDYFSLKNSNSHLTPSLDYFLEKINKLYNFSEEPMLNKKKNLTSKINILGEEIIKDINNYDYKLISKIKRYLKKLQLAKKKKIDKKNNLEKNISESDEEKFQESDSDEEEIEMSEDSDEESVGSREDEFLDLNMLCRKISNNIFQNSEFLLKLFSNRFSNGLCVYDEFDKKIVDPDEFDFSFIDEL